MNSLHFIFSNSTLLNISWISFKAALGILNDTLVFVALGEVIPNNSPFALNSADACSSFVTEIEFWI